MKADELMIGNLVKYGSNIVPVKSIHTESVLKDGVSIYVELNEKLSNYCISISEAEPIPLTEEWLRRGGFINRFGNDWTIGELYPELNKREMYIYKNEKGFFCEDFTQPIEFVHQLQIKYFGKTLKHLTFKSK